MLPRTQGGTLDARDHDVVVASPLQGLGEGLAPALGNLLQARQQSITQPPAGTSQDVDGIVVESAVDQPDEFRDRFLAELSRQLLEDGEDGTIALQADPALVRAALVRQPQIIKIARTEAAPS